MVLCYFSFEFLLGFLKQTTQYLCTVLVLLVTSVIYNVKNQQPCRDVGVQSRMKMCSWSVLV